MKTVLKLVAALIAKHWKPPSGQLKEGRANNVRLARITLLFCFYQIEKPRRTRRWTNCPLTLLRDIQRKKNEDSKDNLFVTYQWLNVFVAAEGHGLKKRQSWRWCLNFFFSLWSRAAAVFGFFRKSTIGNAVRKFRFKNGDIHTKQLQNTETRDSLKQRSGWSPRWWCTKCGSTILQYRRRNPIFLNISQYGSENASRKNSVAHCFLSVIV